MKKTATSCTSWWGRVVAGDTSIYDVIIYAPTKREAYEQYDRFLWWAPAETILDIVITPFEGKWKKWGKPKPPIFCPANEIVHRKCVITEHGALEEVFCCLRSPVFRWFPFLSLPCEHCKGGKEFKKDVLAHL